MRRHLALAGAVLALLGSTDVMAHGLASALVSIESSDDRTADVLVKHPTLEGRGAWLSVRFAEGCINATEPLRAQRGDSVMERWTVECDSPLTGMEIKVLGLDAMVGEAFIELQTPGIDEWHAMVRRGSPSTRLGLRDAEGPGLDTSYFSLGVDHILSGFDHLLFVLCLLLIVARTRTEAGPGAIARGVLAAVTAFTLGHSITLASATLGWVGVPTAPIELLIACSVLLLAVELARDERDTWTMRFPWVVAFVFGLLHGFGFAGALAEIGLPPDGIAAPLLLFNLGVEAGQIGVVLAAMAAMWAIRRVAPRSVTVTHRRSSFETAAIYGIGTLAGYWCVARATQWWV